MITLFVILCAIYICYILSIEVFFIVLKILAEITLFAIFKAPHYFNVIYHNSVRFIKIFKEKSERVNSSFKNLVRYAYLLW